jgi:hypothetical protein
MTENSKMLIGVSASDPRFYAHLKVSTLEECKKAYEIAAKQGSKSKMCKIIARIKHFDKQRSNNGKDNPEAAASQYKAGLYFAMDLAEQFGKEE